MALDYVLAHPEVLFLATEEEKVNYFTRKLGIDLACLPTRIYYSKTPASIWLGGMVFPTRF